MINPEHEQAAIIRELSLRSMPSPTLVNKASELIDRTESLRKNPAYIKVAGAYAVHEAELITANTEWEAVRSSAKFMVKRALPWMRCSTEVRQKHRAQLEFESFLFREIPNSLDRQYRPQGRYAPRNAFRYQPINYAHVIFDLFEAHDQV